MNPAEARGAHGDSLHMRGAQEHEGEDLSRLREREKAFVPSSTLPRDEEGDGVTVRSCRICNRQLSESNKSPDLCFHHQTPPTEFGRRIIAAREAHETFVRGAAPVCSSRVNSGRIRTAIDYDGDPRNA